jgi:aminopeptidase N
MFCWLIVPALALVLEISQTGTIFFPKNWLDASLGSQNSTEAATIVRSFLASNPDYPARLREKILQSADMLFRSSKAL